MTHVFVLILVIGGEQASETCDQAMCFYDLNRCNYFAKRLRRNTTPSTSSPVSAYCKPTLVDPQQDGIRVY